MCRCVCGTDAGRYKQEGVRCEKHTSTNEIKVTHGVVSANDKVKTGTEVDHSRNERDGAHPEQVTAVQTRAMAAKNKLPPKSLKVKTVPGLDTGPEKLKEKQRSDPTLKKYEETCELAKSKNELTKVKTRNRKHYIYNKRSTCLLILRRISDFLYNFFTYIHIYIHTYTVSQKRDTILLSTVSSNIDRFSKFFHPLTQQETFNNEVIKDSTTPQMRRYTTL